MRLVQRIDGKCDKCKIAFTTEAYTVSIKEHVLMHNGKDEYSINEKYSSSYTICPACHYHIIESLKSCY